MAKKKEINIRRDHFTDVRGEGIETEGVDETIDFTRFGFPPEKPEEEDDANEG